MLKYNQYSNYKNKQQNKPQQNAGSIYTKIHFSYIHNNMKHILILSF